MFQGSSIYESKSELERLRDGIDAAWDEARKFGLDPFPTHFELVPASIMYEFASYSLPGRFSHWTHGKAYYRQKMQYDFGLRSEERRVGKECRSRWSADH